LRQRRGLQFKDNPRQIVHENYFFLKKKKKSHRKKTGGVALGVGPEFKPQYWVGVGNQKRFDILLLMP
jgi:hypothetical protein